MDVSESASISTAIAGRYATAMFELARDGDALGALEADTAALEGALADSADLRAAIHSPLHGRDAVEAAIGAIAAAMGLGGMTANALRLMARKRRLFVLPALLAELRVRIADHKGEVTADVVSAEALTEAQSKTLADALAAAVGKSVTLNAAVDGGLIGGLVVRVGSKMIDTSIRCKLGALRNSMKEVG